MPAGAFSEDGKKHVTSTLVRLRKLQGIEQVQHQGNIYKIISLKMIIFIFI
jgi:hypothetical protein